MEGLNAAEEMENFYSRCLLCTCRPEVTAHLHIFSEAGNQLKLSEKINKYLNIQIVSELPQNVCHICMEKLEVTHKLVTSSQQASITLLQIKQQWESFGVEVKQEISECPTELDCYQPSTNSAANYNENSMDIKPNELHMDNTSCSADNFEQSHPAPHFSPQTEEKLTAPFEEIFISKDHTIKLEPEEAPTPSNLDQQIPDTNAIKCHLCNNYFESGEQLKNHISIFHAMKGQSFKCCHCNESFPSFPRLKSHCLSTHPGKYILQCDVCRAEYSSYEGYWRHKLYKHGPRVLTCTICKATFANPQVLKDHMSSVHAVSEQPFSCTTCGAKFKCKRYLTRHVHDVHSGIMLQCKLCSFSTRRKDNLNSHLKTKHSFREKKLACKYCNAKFTFQRYLDRHVMWVHTGPFLKCDMCDYTIRRKTTLIKHIKGRHLKIS